MHLRALKPMLKTLIDMQLVLETSHDLYSLLFSPALPPTLWRYELN